MTNTVSNKTLFSVKIIHGGKLHFAMIGKLCVSIIFAIIYVYSLELFPTLMRHVPKYVSTLILILASIVITEILGSVFAQRQPDLEASLHHLSV